MKQTNSTLEGSIKTIERLCRQARKEREYPALVQGLFAQIQYMARNAEENAYLLVNEEREERGLEPLTRS